MAQFSMEIMRLTGSVPRGNQQIVTMKDKLQNSAYSVRLEKALAWIANGGLQQAIAARKATIAQADLQIAVLKADRARAQYELIALTGIRKRVLMGEEARLASLQKGLAAVVAKAAEAQAIRDAVLEFLSLDELDTIMSVGLGIPSFHQDVADFELSGAARAALIEKLAIAPDYAFADGEAEEIIAKADARHPEWVELHKARAIIRVMETRDYGDMDLADLRDGAFALQAVAERAKSFIHPGEQRTATRPVRREFEDLLRNVRTEAWRSGTRLAYGEMGEVDAVEAIDRFFDELTHRLPVERLEPEFA